MTGPESVKAYKSGSTPFVRIEGLALSQGQAAPHGTSKPLSTPQSGQGYASRGLWRRSEGLRPLCSIPRPHAPRAELALISGKIREGTGGPKGQEERSQQLPPDNPLPGAPWTLL